MTSLLLPSPNMPFGAAPAGVRIRFRAWASGQESLALRTKGRQGPLASSRLDGEWHGVTTDEAALDALYRSAPEPGASGTDA